MASNTRDYTDHNDFHDVESGPAFEEWTAGMDERRPPHSSALDGDWVLYREDGAVITLTLDDRAATWAATSSTGESTPEHDWISQGVSPSSVEVLPLPGDIFFIDLVIDHGAPTEQSGLTIVLDRSKNRALIIHSWTFDRGDARRTASSIQTAGVGGIDVDPIARSTELVGRRALWVYSDRHAYEHVYFNAGTYAWHCVAGPEKSIADVDQTKTFKLSDTAYVFFVTETAQPWDGVFLLDFTPEATVNIGRFFGWDPKPDIPSHNTFGAIGRILNQTDYSF